MYLGLLKNNKTYRKAYMHLAHDDTARKFKLAQKLYQVACENGHWGFWCNAVDEAVLQETHQREVATGKERKPDSRFVGAFLGDGSADSGSGVVRVYAIDTGDCRRQIIRELPKTRTFFRMPTATELGESSVIKWVGHTQCFPFHELTRRQMITEVGSDCLVAVYTFKDCGDQNAAGTVLVPKGSPIPPTICCDL